MPPTLVSFAVDVAELSDVITPELKAAGNALVVFTAPKDADDMPDFAAYKEMYDDIHDLIRDGVIVSAYALGAMGLAPAMTKMALGNGCGVEVSADLTPEMLFATGYGDLLVEVTADNVEAVLDGNAGTRVVGTVTDDGRIVYKDTMITAAEILDAWTKPLDGIFPYYADKTKEVLPTRLYDGKAGGKVYVCKHKVARPKVFIPVFPGTNCEYDSAKAFAAAGAEPVVKVFKNLTAEDIRASVDVFKKCIDEAQIVMFPGGFSAGDEPEGSAKFFAAAFRNEVLTDAMMRLLNERDGLALGICNGFQALIKLGLVPGGEITDQRPDAPTLTYNTIGRHISKMAYTKVVSNKSPWLAEAELGGIYVNPISHGEGRFVAPEDKIEVLFANGQVATQYVNFETGDITMDEEFNPNGSFAAIEGVTSPDGRVFGKMAHSERKGEGVAINITGRQELGFFASGVKYFR